MDVFLSLIAGALAGIAASTLMIRRHLRASKPAAPATDERAQSEPIAPAPPTTIVEPPTQPDTIEALLPILNKALAPPAEELHHPEGLAIMPEFQAAVAAFRRPDASLAILKQYALGSNWPFACAAFIVLAQHPERQSIAEAVLRQLDGMRPFVLPFALRFLTTLDPRPPVGVPALAAPHWWQNNPVIPGFFLEYFTLSAALGDTPDFGGLLQRRGELETSSSLGLLQKVQHPFADRLIALLKDWEATRIDRTFLREVGTLLDPADKDKLLVAPPAWQPLLVTAATAIRQARPRSILVTGGPRVGKSSLLRLLATTIEADGWTVFLASGNELMADQMYIGQLEGRIRKLVEQLHSRRKIVWYVRDLAQIASSGTHQGQTASILDQILPAVAAGTLVIVGEMSEAAAARLFQSRPALRSMMEVLQLPAMTESQTLDLAGDVGLCLQDQTGIAILEPALTAAMDLAQQYLGSGQLPGAVLELLKRAAARSVSAREVAVTAHSVIATLAQLSGLPEVILDTSQRVDLATVHAFFSARVIGQVEAVKAVVDRIAMLKAGLTDPGRPIGVFLFAGPTGTGKTELAKTLAEFLFGSPERMARLDMSEFQTPESTSKILGQRGEGSAESLIDRIRKQPFSVVLLDEFEKAHPNCWDLFLQIFDDGRLTDANGREADFRHCFIILTSNLGATLHRGAGLGFRPDPGTFADDQVLRTISQTFRPEFVNRLDKIIVFQPLSRELMRSVLHKELARIQDRRGLREREWAVEWEASAIEFLLDRGFSPEMGARPLKRAIDQHLLAPLAGTLVEHRFPKGDQFLFVRSDGTSIEVEFVDPDAEPAQAAAPEIEVEETVSLPSIVLRQTGSVEERASLTQVWREIDGELSGEAWLAAQDALRLELADPAIWSREDRFAVFSRLETMDRVGEAARTADRLFQRYAAAGDHRARASRELAARLALQLFNLRHGLADVASNAPIDVLVRVEPAMEAGSDGVAAAPWCRRIEDMYRQWAGKRRMQIKELLPRDGKGGAILHVTGFGAHRTMAAEAGLHVLEEDGADGARRWVARVTITRGPDQDPPEPGRHAATARLLATAPAASSIIRRYREAPAPMVRDLASGWRSGRLDAVLSGDFDVMGAVAKA